MTTMSTIVSWENLDSTGRKGGRFDRRRGRDRKATSPGAKESSSEKATCDGDVKKEMKKLEVLSEVPGSAAMRFASKTPQGMDTFWELAGEDTWEEATIYASPS